MNLDYAMLLWGLLIAFGTDYIDVQQFSPCQNRGKCKFIYAYTCSVKEGSGVISRNPGISRLLRVQNISRDNTASEGKDVLFLLLRICIP